jgi:hypothetical protein
MADRSRASDCHRDRGPAKIAEEFQAIIHANCGHFRDCRALLMARPKIAMARFVFVAYKNE